MKKSRDYFALDWIKAELDQTLAAARQALEEFAHVYADQAEQDYGQLQQAITELKIPVQTGL